jgi:hypothetical protein
MVFEYLLPTEGQVGVEDVMVSSACLDLGIICNITTGRNWYNRVRICIVFCHGFCFRSLFCCLCVLKHCIAHANYWRQLRGSRGTRTYKCMVEIPGLLDNIE